MERVEALAPALEAAYASPFFGIALTALCYVAGKRINARYPSVLTSPFLVTVVLVIAFLFFSGVPLSSYQVGGDILSMMLVPATAILGTTIYSRRVFLRENFLPLVVGGLVGAATSIASVWTLSRAFGVDEAFMRSMMPKSVTTPIAMELSALSGGIVPISIIAVAFTGIFGVVLGPLVTKVTGVTDPIAVGAAYGTASHVIGTSKAVEIGETEAAASSVSICMAGLMTVGVYLVFLI